ncbi:unnamed protein product [Urochloa humidicola]
MGAEAKCDRIRGPWSPEEDDALRRLVERNGARNLMAIGREIPSRTGKFCRHRPRPRVPQQPLGRHRAAPPRATVRRVRAGRLRDEPAG